MLHTIAGKPHIICAEGVDALNRMIEWLPLIDIRDFLNSPSFPVPYRHIIRLWVNLSGRIVDKHLPHGIGQRVIYDCNIEQCTAPRAIAK